MELITRTIYSSYLQTCLLTGMPFELQPNSTLNEKLGIQSGVAPAQGTYPKLRYMAIGNKGLRDNTGADGILNYIPNQHLATDAAAYNQIPFILRRPDNDLSPVERQNYALRKEETHDGETWIAYYLRRMDFSEVLVTREKIIVDEDGNAVRTNFVADQSNLNPEPQFVDESGTNLLTGQYVSASAKIRINLSPWEIQELINVARVLYNNEGSTIISEVQLVTGVDKTISVTGVGGTFNFQEVIAAQVASHITTNYPTLFSQNGLELFLDVGSTEPLWKITP